MTTWDNDDQFRAELRAIMSRHEEAQKAKERQFVGLSFAITIGFVGAIYYIIGRML